jgi:hypothetical protein
MAVLTSIQRGALEKVVIKARKLAETGANNALKALAVHEAEPYAHMNAEDRKLRNLLRSKGRLLGDELKDGKQSIHKIAYELAYEYWHKMLFAAFLEANNLLMHSSGVAVSFEDVEELAPEEGYPNKWAAAASYASKMLPAIFRVDDPVMKVEFSSNDRIALESLLESIDEETLIGDDALGWVYQFWQSEAKITINEIGDPIDGESLPAVTQLFTEPYMVHYLIDNTIGAWWVGRHPGETPPVEFEYLRKLDDGTPAAGKFEGWPNTTAEVTSMDPCMGSGHFVASLFPVFAKLRMHEEGLSKEEATDRVIIENLHGLELDPRCTQLAAFNLALTAWRFCGMYRELPEMNLACSGIAPKGKEEDWVNLVQGIEDENDRYRMENGMRELYKHFQLAPELGSLLNPGIIKADAHTAPISDLLPVLYSALNNEKDAETKERGVLAAGIAHAGQLLSRKFILQITNVPYLKRHKQSDVIRDFADKYYKSSKGDLATIFLSRMLNGIEPNGHISIVSPHNWLFLGAYKTFRNTMLCDTSLLLFATLGSGAFETISGEVVNVDLQIIQKRRPTTIHDIVSIQVANEAHAHQKAIRLFNAHLVPMSQNEQMKNPDQRIIFQELNDEPLLAKIANGLAGYAAGDSVRFERQLHEIPQINSDWEFLQGTVNEAQAYGGRSLIIHWQEGAGDIFDLAESVKDINHIAQNWLRGEPSWGKKGVVVSQMGKLVPTLYGGDIYNSNCCAVVPEDQANLIPLWCFAESGLMEQEIRKIDQKVNVTNSTLTKIPFDLSHWQKVSFEKYPNGLPEPYSDDPTQWLFHGHPTKAESPLQVALGRVLGYRWPAENDEEMELSSEARELIENIKAFDHLSDEDGILCIPSVNGEAATADELRGYLQQVWGGEWNNQTIDELLKTEGSNKTDLEKWLREEFFVQHCKLFGNRPFIWHIWDGRNDGFGALVNYHQLTKDGLNKLIYAYLGDWIRQCEARLKSGASGADGQIAAAKALKEKLLLILEGEPPYDVFVRWKSAEEQPIGWDPDLNDGVRMNIYPFMQAGVLRKKPNIKWTKDRGKNPEGSNWGPDRFNRYEDLDDEHKLKDANGQVFSQLSVAVKRELRDKVIKK